jgi:2-iminobutanoate/2-iminopropanoate deaminase
MPKTEISTKKAPAAIGPYSQAVKTSGLLFVSGQIAINPETGHLVAGSIEAETRQVLNNLAAILQAAGTSFDNVIKTTIFLKDMNDFQVVNEIYGSVFRPPFPARATVEVSRLPKDVNVEIDCIAKV